MTPALDDTALDRTCSISAARAAAPVPRPGGALQGAGNEDPPDLVSCTGFLHRADGAVRSLLA